MDAIDETGVLEDPGDRIGYVLRDEGEAVAMAKVGLRLNYAQQDPTEEGWRSVAEAAAPRSTRSQRLQRGRFGEDRPSEPKGRR